LTVLEEATCLCPALSSELGVIERQTADIRVPCSKLYKHGMIKTTGEIETERHIERHRHKERHRHRQTHTDRYRKRQKEADEEVERCEEMMTGGTYFHLGSVFRGLHRWWCIPWVSEPRRCCRWSDQHRLTQTQTTDCQSTQSVAVFMLHWLRHISVAVTFYCLGHISVAVMLYCLGHTSAAIMLHFLGHISVAVMLYYSGRLVVATVHCIPFGQWPWHLLYDQCSCYYALPTFWAVALASLIWSV